MIVQIIGWFCLVMFFLHFTVVPFYIKDNHIYRAANWIDSTLLLICAAICFK